MSYKTILVNAELSPRAEHIVACAGRIAEAEQRFRELVMGGATRTVLHRMTLPVLMSQ
jgi:nucleotide-binding universal stress UspA family protein